MDLGAYGNIATLDGMVKEAGISVPRLRGYRLMADEEPVGLSEVFNEWVIEGLVSDLCCSIPYWSPHTCCHTYSSWTSRLKHYYVDYSDKNHPKVRWDRIHGWKRRVLKTYIHNEKQKYKKQYDIFNKYCGRTDILYIHARIGGGNWPAYKDDVIHEPWFIEKVDDAFDSTYCDIYAKLS